MKLGYLISLMSRFKRTPSKSEGFVAIVGFHRDHIITIISKADRPRFRQMFRTELLELCKFLRERNVPRDTIFEAMAEKDAWINSLNLHTGDSIRVTFTCRIPFDRKEDAALLRLFFSDKFSIAYEMRDK